MKKYFLLSACLVLSAAFFLSRCDDSSGDEGQSEPIHCLYTTACWTWYDLSSCLSGEIQIEESCAEHSASEPDYAGNCTFRNYDNSGPSHIVYYYYGYISDNRENCYDGGGYFAEP